MAKNQKNDEIGGKFFVSDSVWLNPCVSLHKISSLREVDIIPKNCDLTKKVNEKEKIPKF